MSDSDGYVYRYDSLAVASRLVRQPVARAPLESDNKGQSSARLADRSEKSLAAGQGIFRISFWKVFGAALQSFGATYRTSLAVLQRVRDDHPFLASLTREDDDWLKPTAWLYWKIDAHAHEQEWSVDGIFLDDVEVLDLDGTWRRFKDALIMKSAETRLAGRGFLPILLRRLHFLDGLANAYRRAMAR